MEEAVSERRKAFAAAHRSDEDRQAYIFIGQAWLYSIYDGVIRRNPVSDVRIESIGSAGQVGFNYQALV